MANGDWAQLIGARGSRWLFAIASAHLAACHSADRPSPSVSTAPLPTPVVLVASPPPASSSPTRMPPTPPPTLPDAADAPSDDEEVGSLELVDPDPSRPMPKAPYFIEVRGDHVDAVNVAGCGKSKVPSAVYTTYDHPEQLILCADGAANAGPNLTLGIPSARRAGQFDYGHSEFALDDGYFSAPLQLTVLVTKYGPVGKTIEGSYITDVRSLDGSTKHTFFGRFRVLREPDSRSVHF